MLTLLASPALGFDLTGWNPHHGHVTVSGYVPPHTHGHETSAEPAQQHHSHESADAGESGIGFTRPDCGIGHGSPAIAGGAIVSLPAGGHEAGGPCLTAQGPVVTQVLAPPTPPPQVTAR